MASTRTADWRRENMRTQTPMKKKMRQIPSFWVRVTVSKASEADEHANISLVSRQKDMIFPCFLPHFRHFPGIFFPPLIKSLQKQRITFFPSFLIENIKVSLAWLITFLEQEFPKNSLCDLENESVYGIPDFVTFISRFWGPLTVCEDEQEEQEEEEEEENKKNLKLVLHLHAKKRHSSSLTKTILSPDRSSSKVTKSPLVSIRHSSNWRQSKDLTTFTRQRTTHTDKEVLVIPHIDKTDLLHKKYKLNEFMPWEATGVNIFFRTVLSRIQSSYLSRSSLMIFRMIHHQVPEGFTRQFKESKHFWVLNQAEYYLKGPIFRVLYAQRTNVQPDNTDCVILGLCAPF